MDEWAQASRDWAAHVHELTGLPVFTLGSSLGVAAAISAIDSPAVTGAILMGSLQAASSTTGLVKGLSWATALIGAALFIGGLVSSALGAWTARHHQETATSAERA